MNSPRRAILLSSLGAGFEYYDFIIYGMMAEILSPLFFANNAPWLGLAKTFAIFAVAYIFRPLGGLFFGSLGDTYGRKKTFLTVMLLMAIATFSIGALPTYAHIGGLAPCLLLILRILQGFSFGAELPCAITVACEYSQTRKQGESTGFVIASTSIGATLASFVLYCLTKTLTQEQIVNWGWRLPFLFGGILALVNYFIRRHLQETPEFLREEAIRKSGPVERQEPINELFTNYKGEIVQGIGMTCFASSLIIFCLYLPNFLTHYFSYKSADVYFATMLGMIESAVILPIAGRFVDEMEKRLILKYTSIFFVGGALPLFLLLNTKTFAALLIFIGVIQFFIAIISVCYFPLLASLFPTKVRYSGIATSYNLTFSLMALLPMLLTGLIQYFNTPYCIIFPLALFSLFTYLAVDKTPSYNNPLKV